MTYQSYCAQMRGLRKTPMSQADFNIMQGINEDPIIKPLQIRPKKDAKPIAATHANYEKTNSQTGVTPPSPKLKDISLALRFNPECDKVVPQRSKGGVYGVFIRSLTTKIQNKTFKKCFTTCLIEARIAYYWIGL